MVEHEKAFESLRRITATIKNTLWLYIKDSTQSQKIHVHSLQSEIRHESQKSKEEIYNFKIKVRNLSKTDRIFVTNKQIYL